VSSLLAAGVIIGYGATEIFLRRYHKTGRVKSLVLKIGNWRIHVHHWITGTLLMGVFAVVSSLSFLPLGIIGGVIFHDLYTDKSWHQIFYKKQE